MTGFTRARCSATARRASSQKADKGEDRDRGRRCALMAQHENCVTSPKVLITCADRVDPVVILEMAAVEELDGSLHGSSALRVRRKHIQ
jgi:hypothetical protein